MKPKVLVTGCAGYIGSMLVPALLGKGFNVVGVDKFFYLNQSAVLGFLGHPNFRLVQCDVGRFDLYDNAIREADIVIPLAALVGAPVCKRFEEEAVRVNFACVASLMKLLSPRQRVIFPNTNSGYGLGFPDRACTEDDPMNPLSLYASSKCEAEKVVLDRGNSVSLRLATVFGTSPRMRFDLMVNDFVRTLYYKAELEIFEGGFRRNFVHVRDVANAFFHMIQEDQMNGAFNVGNPFANMTKRNLGKHIAHLMGFATSVVTEGTGEDPDKRDYEISNEKILGTDFVFQHSLQNGVEEVHQLLRLNIPPSDSVRMKNV